MEAGYKQQIIDYFLWRFRLLLLLMQPFLNSSDTAHRVSKAGQSIPHYCNCEVFLKGTTKNLP
jgi:hypothetical protein